MAAKSRMILYCDATGGLLGTFDVSVGDLSSVGGRVGPEILECLGFFQGWYELMRS